VDIEIKNAKIESTMLGFEDHGIFTCFLQLDYGGGGQGFGGYTLGGKYGSDFIKAILETVGVNEWEKLPGKHIRVKAERTKIHEIGNIIIDKWFNPSEILDKCDKV
jgi:hypothetical protein